MEIGKIYFQWGGALWGGAWRSKGRDEGVRAASAYRRIEMIKNSMTLSIVLLKSHVPLDPRKVTGAS